MMATAQEKMTRFTHWYFNDFTQTSHYDDMVNVTENSPWHREQNVAVHTNMVVANYLSRATEPNHNTLLGAFACAFHDVGKPRAKEEKWSEDRGDYVSFGGHELLSARIWESWAVLHWNMLQDNFDFSVQDVYSVGWMIEHHLPWGIRKGYKLQALAQTHLRTLGFDHTFQDVLWADQIGRVADDQQGKLISVRQWLAEYQLLLAQERANFIRNAANAPKTKTLFVPIGASGCGKSTFSHSAYFNAEDAPNVARYSWDDLRLLWYVNEEEGSAEELYKLAFDRSVADKSFSVRTQAEFTRLIQQGVNIYIDNTNLTRKVRRQYVTMAHNHGYHVVAILFPCEVGLLVERQAYRGDKNVPRDAIIQQYYRLQLPQYGEVDEVLIQDHNLPPNY